MDSGRRAAVSDAGRKVLPVLHRAVVASWPDLMPASTAWSGAATTRARAAARSALSAMIELFGQGDLEDRAWAAVRREVLADGRATAEEAADLVRTVRVIGVELLAKHLEEEVGLTRDERWQLQQEAAAFCDAVVGERPEPDAEAFDRMLADLHAQGPDLA